MDTNIAILEEQETSSGWSFGVKIESEGTSTEHVVTVDREHWKELTGGKEKPQNLVKRSFDFLLMRESKESIMREFNLRVISTYFPEYEEKIKI